MQYNVNGDDEALSLTTVKETEGLNHMRQHVEDHQQIDKEFMQPTVAKRAGNGKAHSKNTTAMTWSPPSLSDCGRIRSGSKCDLIQCIDKLVGTEESHNHATILQTIVTKGEEVLCSPPATGRNKLSLCSHEEVETRIMVHITDAVQDGHQSVMIRSTDTDVVVLTVAAVATLDRKELWVSYETGKNQKILPAHLSPSPPCLPIFHALTGCDTTSFFAGYGKRPAWAVWENFPNVTSTFLELAGTPSSISEENLCTIERFIILIYDRTNHLSKVNDARKCLFTKKGRGLEGVPSTRDALEQHVKCAVYQGGYVRGQATVLKPVLPEPTNWGWTLGREKQVQRAAPLWL
ncbi:unnamed protein product [Porites lobata]|uniref:Uncharacterized protein n=1 Tax=Porites lobata TaxID=104759 RepID=A0ABN8NWW3_9CNID|nr:unnamed protein product [Porites lobata]